MTVSIFGISGFASRAVTNMLKDSGRLAKNVYDPILFIKRATSAQSNNKAQQLECGATDDENVQDGQKRLLHV